MLYWVQDKREAAVRSDAALGSWRESLWTGLVENFMDKGLCHALKECVSEKERKEALLKAGRPSPSTLCKLRTVYGP